MKKPIIAIIVVIVVAIAAFAIFHKSSSAPTSNSSQTASQSSVPAVNNAVLITKTDSTLGQYLADPSGKPLYTYNADTQGVSNCSGSCLVAWPAYVDNGSTSNLPSDVSTIKRADNSQTQYTYHGLPLYFFASDSVGNPTGNGVQNFSIAKPMVASASSSPSSSSSSSAPATSNSTSSSSGSPY